MKVLLIYPDYKINIDPDTGRQTGVEKGGWYQEGAASISAVLKQDGCEVTLYHLLEPEGKASFQRRIRGEAPDLIGFITMTREYPQVKEYAAWVKEVADVPVISGSYHPSAMPEEVIATEGIDIICLGEAEDAMLELTRAMRAGEDYSRIPSLWIKRGGEIIRNPVRPLREDLDTLPIPDFGLYDFDKLRSSQIKTGLAMLSRGCPYSCTYCINSLLRSIYPNKGKYQRFHSPAYSIEYLHALIAAYPQIEYVNFRDDILLWKGGWLEEFTGAYKREIGLPFMCNYRANLMTPEIARVLRDAGCFQIYLGVESGNDYIRNEVLKRHMSREQIVDAFAACRDAGIKTVAYNMVGLPFEDLAAVLDTVKLNAEIRADVFLNPIFYPFPNTRLYDVAVEEGFVPAEYDYREERYVDQPTLRRDQLFFACRYFKTFVRAYRLERRLPPFLAGPAEKLTDRVWLSPLLPHRMLVRVAERRDLLVAKAKEKLLAVRPDLYLKLRDRVRGVER